MPLDLAMKKEIVADVSNIAQQSVSLVAADYRGLTSNEMTELRAKARASGVVLRVVRNTLARRAFDGDYACIREKLVGPLILAFSQESPSAAARLLKDFAKDHQKLSVIALSVGGNLYGVEHLDAVAALPSRNEALARLMAVMKAPLSKLVGTLVAPHQKLVRTVDAVRVQKENAA